MSAHRQSAGPEEIVARALAVEGNNPVIKRVCLTSGGGDSTVLAHRCRDMYDELVHVDTGTALPGVRDFVEQFAREVVDKPLRVVEAGDAYKRLVLGHQEWWDVYAAQRLPDESPDDFRRRTSKLETRQERLAMKLNLAPMGFPGPAGHRFAYQRLKERSIEEALRQIKREFGGSGRRQRVVLMSGVRLDESARRKMTGTAQGEWERRGNQVWVNPLLYWSNEEMRFYRSVHGLPVSDVTALIHRSGECNCLAFAGPGEREELISMFPSWYREQIEPIEVEARRLGLEHHQWGWGATRERGAAKAGPMCSDCTIRVA
jgi:3'-phosphoadenosine 5'-phosphosulfate sulfotransferase (PAPS reductase)/FAD synthetase